MALGCLWARVGCLGSVDFSSVCAVSSTWWGLPSPPPLSQYMPQDLGASVVLMVFRLPMGSEVSLQIPGFAVCGGPRAYWVVLCKWRQSAYKLWCEAKEGEEN